MYNFLSDVYLKVRRYSVPERQLWEEQVQKCQPGPALELQHALLRSQLEYEFFSEASVEELLGTIVVTNPLTILGGDISEALQQHDEADLAVPVTPTGEIATAATWYVKSSSMGSVAQVLKVQSHMP